MVASCAWALSLGVTQAADAARMKREQGTIKSVDIQNHVIQLTSSRDKTEHKYQWTDQTKFTSGRDAISAARLKEGESVSVTYTPGGEVPLLQHVRVVPKEPKQTAVSPATHRHAT